MPEPFTIKPETLVLLYAAWEEPDKHRVRADSGEGTIERKSRRSTSIKKQSTGKSQVLFCILNAVLQRGAHGRQQVGETLIDTQGLRPTLQGLG